MVSPSSSDTVTEPASSLTSGPDPGGGRVITNPRTLDEGMRLAIAAAWPSRTISPPNPWVGAVVVNPAGDVVGVGRTQAPGGAHAEIGALEQAGPQARGSTLFTTLEPCSHHGRTGPCADAIVQAGVARVVVGVLDPDRQVAGRGMARLRSADIEVVEGVCANEVSQQLEPYLHHRRCGRPFVVLKLAMTLDGRLAAPDGTSSWITGEAARRDVHRLRSESDAILVGAGTVRADNPSLTTRLVDGPDPRRYVLGKIPEDSAVLPATSVSGSLDSILDVIGRDGALQLMVEGGGSVAGAFHRAGLVDRYVVYIAPALLGGDDGVPVFRGAGGPTMADLWRGRFRSITQLGEDIRIELDRSATTVLSGPGRNERPS